MLKRLFRVAVYGGLLLVVASAIVWTWLRGTDATAADFKTFKQGDIIFQTSRSGQSAGILLASKSLYSHMGIIDFDEAGALVVLEATATTRATPLADWAKRGVGSRTAVYRVAGLAEKQAQAVSAAGRLDFGKPYDLFFFSSDRTLLQRIRAAGVRKRCGFKIQRIGTLDL